MKRMSFIAALFWLAFHAFAAEVYQLPDPVQQKTYESLTSQLRCLVCQNQTIADSHAELAGDLRRQVYEMLQQGKSEQEIVQFMTDRYGDFVLYNPPFKAKTGLLWLGPALFLGVGLLAVVIIIRRKSRQSAEGLEPSQREKIRSLLDNEEKS